MASKLRVNTLIIVLNIILLFEFWVSLSKFFSLSFQIAHLQQTATFT